MLEGLKCVECNAVDLRVTQSRTVLDTIRRRRECKECGARFWTVEIPEDQLPSDPDMDFVFVRKQAPKVGTYDRAVHDKLDWRKIDEAPGYEVSETGLVRSVKGGVPRLRKLMLSLSGRLVLQVRVNGKPKTVSVARAVLGAFVGKRESRVRVRYKDRDKANCALSNLEWME